MTSQLKKLLDSDGVKASDWYGGKQSYFLKHSNLIWKLHTERGIPYSVIIKALRADGLDISYGYFKKLMRNEIKKRAEKTGSEIRESSSPESASFSSAPSPPTLPSGDAEKKQLREKYEEIKGRKDITDKEKRELMAQAAKEYADKRNPLR